MPIQAFIFPFTKLVYILNFRVQNYIKTEFGIMIKIVAKYALLDVLALKGMFPRSIAETRVESERNFKLES